MFASKHWHVIGSSCDFGLRRGHFERRKLKQVFDSNAVEKWLDLEAVFRFKNEAEFGFACCKIAYEAKKRFKI